jgi:hypothetical protein
MGSNSGSGSKSRHPARKIYAMRKTGLIVGEKPPITSEQEREWNDAIEEYFRLIDEGKKQ